MLLIDSILGNAYDEKNLSKKIENAKQNQTLKRLFLSRSQMEKSRLRTETEDGTEIGLSLEPGTVLHNGDVLEINSNLIVIHQLPEKIIRVTINENKLSPNLLVQLGHIIGNRHRPISLNDDYSVSFPIHDDSEIELFQKLFQDANQHLILNIEETIFVPNDSMNVHEH